MKSAGTSSLQKKNRAIQTNHYRKSVEPFLAKKWTILTCSQNYNFDASHNMEKEGDHGRTYKADF